MTPRTVLIFIFYFSIFSFLNACSERTSYWDHNFFLYKITSSTKNQNINKIQIDELSNGKPILILNFSAPHCRPCIEEAPIIAELSRGRSKHFQFIPVISSLECIGRCKNNNGTHKKKYSPKDELFQQSIVNAETFRIKYNLADILLFADSCTLKNLKISGFPETIIFFREEKKWKFYRKYTGIINKNQLTQDARKAIQKYAGL